MSIAKLPKMSAAQFLEWERPQRDKYQLLDSVVYAMAGGSPRHNHLCTSVLAQLFAGLRGSPCGTLSSDQKLFIPAKGNYVYPDGAVVCGPVALQVGTTDVVENPSIVLEVLSSSTEKHDRGDKWDDYQTIPSLTDYVIVSQRVARVEHFARESDGSWRYRVAGPGERLVLTTGTVLVIDEIFERAFDFPGDG